MDNKAADTVLELDVAIVGGGVAGCYAAYRLLNGTFGANSPLAALAKANGGSLRVGLFERAARLGGRLLSVEIPDIAAGADPDKLKLAEFGGFRFQEQMHIVADLAEHLSLEHQPFPVDEPENNPIYVRGRRLTRGQVDRGEDLPYALTQLELDIVQGKYAEQGNASLTDYVANQAFYGYLPNSAGAPCGLPNGWSTLQGAYADAFAAEEWDRVAALREQYEEVKQQVKVDGRLLTDWSWWALMTRFLSEEAIAMMEDTSGYNSLYSSGNAPTGLMEGFYFSDARSGKPDTACTNTTWKHIKAGYSAMPLKLYEGFCAKKGQTFTSHSLVRFDKVDGGYKLVFSKRTPGSSKGTGCTPPGSGGEGSSPTATAKPAEFVEVEAAHVILALPKRSLELLEQDNFFFSVPRVQSLLDSVISIDAMRIFMAYSQPWWVRQGATCGRSTTDLPVRQFYYWLTSDTNQNSVVLASYTNGEAQKYWQTLQSGTCYPSPALVSADNIVAVKYGPRGGSQAMGDLAHQQLMQVLGVHDAPAPCYVHFQNWAHDPWGGGWHAWATGSDSDTLIPQSLQPLSDEQIYICGECWSNVQGWVQGALNTAEAVVQTKLGLEWPSWLQAGGTWLGPGT